MQGDLLGIVIEIWVWPHKQTVYAQPRIYQTFLGFWDTKGSPSPSQTTRPYNNKKEITCKIIDFAVQADHRVKLKECKKRDKYLDLARELEKPLEHESDD